MMIKRIKYKIILLAGILIGAICFRGMAQESSGEKYFIYIQNEEGTPFYVKKNDSVLSSTPAGYMIIPQLTKGKYQLTIGLPGNKVPEASFLINMEKPDDKGFLLKTGEGKLSLYSLKDFSQITPVAVASAAGNRIVAVPVPSGHPKKQKKNKIASDNGNDAFAIANTEKSTSSKDQPAGNTDVTASSSDTSEFAKMLNEITGKNEPSAAKTSEKEQPEVNENTGNPPVSADTTRAIAGAPIQQPATEPAEPVKPAKAAGQKPKSEEPTFITFIPDKEKKNTSGTSPENDNTETDTAMTEPAVDSNQIKRQEQPESKAPQPIEERPAEAASAPGDSSSENDFEAALKAAESTVRHQPVQAAEKKNVEATQVQSIPNTDCKNLADEEDFQKIRRKMASRSDQEAMFRIAEKYIKGGICYSSAQIQSLTYLFTSDEYKYKFLELAYPHVYDTAHFASLVKTMNDEYYRGRFNALIGK